MNVLLTDNELNSRDVGLTKIWTCDRRDEEVTSCKNSSAVLVNKNIFYKGRQVDRVKGLKNPFDIVPRDLKPRESYQEREEREDYHAGSQRDSRRGGGGRGRGGRRGGRRFN